MKKLAALLLSIVMMFGLFACGGDPGKSSQESSEQSSKSQSGWVTPSSRPDKQKEEEKMDNYASDNAAKSSISNMNLEGSFYDIFKEYENNWIKHAFDINPELWEVYKDADKYDKNHVLCFWFSEFVGKLLVGTVDAYRVSGDEETGALVKDIIAHLKEIQRENGYVGPFPANYSLPYASDPWGHYFIIVGLCDWYDLTGDEEALQIAKGAAEFLYNSYYDVVNGRFYTMLTDAFNVSIAHGFTLIYEKTQDMRFYEAAKQMVTKAWTFGGNWYQNALNGKEYYETSNKCWECLHSVMALGEMYRITGDEDYYKALDQIWWSIVN
ncbi:MAG: glycoside hydrolase family 127 protein, partial [Oscillospiraceae bacterium]|nr:glycoside hydrolase family 127 protein [Oscillospiraceae bacterium]